MSGTIPAVRYLHPPSPVLHTSRFIRGATDFIYENCGRDGAVLGLSGGIDSDIVCEIGLKALGSDMHAVHLDTGFMRKGECDEVVGFFGPRLGDNLVFADYVAQEFLDAMMNVRYADLKPGEEIAEVKRHVFKGVYWPVLARECSRFGVPSLLQGSIWPDIIESTKRAEGDAVIKSHHNVNPKMDSDVIKRIVEPMAGCYKNEERHLAKALGLPDWITYRMTFPGPSLTVRIVGEITPENLEIEREANHIVETGVTNDVMRQYGVPMYIEANGNHIPWMAFSYTMRAQTHGDEERINMAQDVIQRTLKGRYKLNGCWLMEDKMTGVKGDVRAYFRPLLVEIQDARGEPCYDHDVMEEVSLALTSPPELQLTRVLGVTHMNENGGTHLVGMRAIESQRTMEARFMRLEENLMREMSEEIADIPGVGIVAYEWDHKPPSTMEPE